MGQVRLLFFLLTMPSSCHREYMETRWNSLNPETLPGPDSD